VRALDIGELGRMHPVRKGHAGSALYEESWRVRV
jgi:hypothetical protein